MGTNSRNCSRTNEKGVYEAIQGVLVYMKIQLNLIRCSGKEPALRDWTRGTGLEATIEIEARLNLGIALTAVKRKSMRNVLVPGRRSLKCPAPKFKWNHCRAGVIRKKK